MLDIGTIHEEINDLWPVKRPLSDKDAEKAALEICVKSDEDFAALKNRIEILVCDSDVRKLPTLLSVLSNGNKKVTKPVIVSSLPVDEPEEVEEKDEVEETFKNIFYEWPNNEKPQNQKFARIAFIQAIKTHPLEDVKKACENYCNEMNKPEKAGLHYLGIKRFVSDDEILDDWLQKSEYVSNYDTSYFDAAWSWYPEFDGKQDQGLRDDSRNFYKRFVKEDDVVEFFCAVKAYADECRWRIRDEQNSEDYVPGDENRFTKKFHNFVRIWNKQDCRDEMFNLIYEPFLAAMNKRDFPYYKVYPNCGLEGGFVSPCKCICQKSWQEQHNVKNIVEGVTWLLDYMCQCLTNGEYYDGKQKKTPTEPDYSTVSEVVQACKDKAKQMPPVLVQLS